MYYPDNFLPEYQFREQHRRRIHANAHLLISAAENYRPEQDPFFRKMIGLRELPQRLLEKLGQRPAGGAPPFSMNNFTLLERTADCKLAYGLMGKFWKAGYGLISIDDTTQFTHTRLPGTARLLLTYEVRQIDEQCSELITETRVYCPDAQSLRSFTPYWYLIRPISGVIRRRMLSAIDRSVTGG